MSEKLTYRALSRKIRELDPKARIERIENVLVTGMLDVNLCIQGAESWIEIKDPKEPKRESTKLFGSNHKLSQEQKNWCFNQTKAGGKCFVLISTDKRWMVIKGCFADGINEMTVNELIELSSWHSILPIKDKEQWKALINLLKK